ncbi:MAG: DUF1697 domain-containing protein [Draconibacterium sp.]
MNTYIAILRGINVSGTKPIKMEELRLTFQKLGFENIATYIQSGNVVFNAAETSTSELAAKIAEAIKTDFGFDVPVIVLSCEELNETVENNPLNTGTKDEAFLHVTFLAEKPAAFNFSEIEAKKQGEEEIVISEKAVYLFCPHGYGKTKLTNTFFESKLKVAATTRNWKTCGELLRMTAQT